MTLCRECCLVEVTPPAVRCGICQRALAYEDATGRPADPPPDDEEPRP